VFICRAMLVIVILFLFNIVMAGFLKKNYIYIYIYIYISYNKIQYLYGINILIYLQIKNTLKNNCYHTHKHFFFKKKNIFFFKKRIFFSIAPNPINMRWRWGRHNLFHCQYLCCGGEQQIFLIRWWKNSDKKCFFFFYDEEDCNYSEIKVLI
jgi:hypothetical protein